MHSSPPTLIQLFTGIAGNSSTTIWYTVNPVDSITILITFQHLRSTHQACEPLLPTAAPPSLVWPWQCTSQRRGREEDSSPAYFLHHKYIYFCRSGLGALITPFDTHHCWPDTWDYIHAVTHPPLILIQQMGIYRSGCLQCTRKGLGRRTAAVALHLATGIYGPIQTRQRFMSPRTPGRISCLIW